MASRSEERRVGKECRSRWSFNGEQIGHYAYESAEQLDAALARSAKGYAGWRRTSVAQRAQLMIALAKALRDNAGQMAEMISLEMGKPITQARGEARPGHAGARTDAGEERQRPYRVPPTGCDPGRHAVELPDLAGAAWRGPDPAGRQHLRAQACAERDGQRLSAARWAACAPAPPSAPRRARP